MAEEGKTRGPAKYSTDLLSKVWKPLVSLTPYYSGGKVPKSICFLVIFRSFRYAPQLMEGNFAAFTTHKYISLALMMAIDLSVCWSLKMKRSLLSVLLGMETLSPHFRKIYYFANGTVPLGLVKLLSKVIKCRFCRWTTTNHAHSLPLARLIMLFAYGILCVDFAPTVLNIIMISSAL
jgi:hypothetical protein